MNRKVGNVPIWDWRVFVWFLFWVGYFAYRWYVMILHNATMLNFLFQCLEETGLGREQPSSLADRYERLKLLALRYSSCFPSFD